MLESLYVNSRLTIDLPKQTRDRLMRFALLHGFSLQEFSRRILEEVSSDIPEEPLADYRNAKRLKASLQRALRDWRTGRVRARL